MSFIRKLRRGGRIYLAEVESKRVKGKVIQRHLRYIGREADGRTVLSASISDASIDQVKVYGPLLALHHLAKEIELESLLGPYGRELLSLVFAHCLDYRSVNEMPRWFERTDLNFLLELKGLTEARLLSALDWLEQQDATALQSKIFHTVKKQYGIRDKGVIYDVTNTYLYGRRCSLGQWGHDKEGVKGRPLIQVGLGTTQQKGIPVFHKVFPGNIHDSRTLQDLMTTFGAYGFREGFIVYDRGIPSKKNQKDLEHLHWKVLCGLPIRGGLKKIVRACQRRQPLAHYDHRVSLRKNVFYVVCRPYTLGSVRGTLAVCFNERLQRDVKESRYDELAHAQALRKKKQPIKAGLEKFLTPTGKIVHSKLKEAEEFDGFSCLFSTTPLSKEQMVRMYFDKDLIEKAFRTLKGIVRLRPIRHWLYNRVVAHVFICYLAYLLLSLLKIRVAPLDLTPEESLRELDSLYKVYLRDSKKGFQLSRVVALTKQQELILKTIDKSLLPLV